MYAAVENDKFIGAADSSTSSIKSVMSSAVMKIEFKRQFLSNFSRVLFKLNDKSVMAELIGTTEKQSVNLANGYDLVNRLSYPFFHSIIGASSVDLMSFSHAKRHPIKSKMSDDL